MADLDEDQRIAAALHKLGGRDQQRPAPQQKGRARPSHNARTLKGRAALENASIAPDGRSGRRASGRTAQLNATIDELLKSRLTKTARDHDERIVDIVERALTAELDKMDRKRA